MNKNSNYKALLIELWRQEGICDNEIQKRLCVNLEQLDAIRHKGSKYLQTVVAQVEMALLKKAVGYSYIETKKILDLDKLNEDSKGKTETITKHIPPDMSAIKVWLEGQAPQNWAKKEDKDMEGYGVVILPSIEEGKNE